MMYCYLQLLKQGMAPLLLATCLYPQGNIPIYQLNYFQKQRYLPQLHQDLQENIKVLLLLIHKQAKEFYLEQFQNQLCQNFYIQDIILILLDFLKLQSGLLLFQVHIQGDLNEQLDFLQRQDLNHTRTLQLSHLRNQQFLKKFQQPMDYISNYKYQYFLALN